MKALLATAGALLLLGAASSPSFGQTPAASPAASCAPINGLNFVCGVQNPEDLERIPGTRWLITSGLKVGAGVKLVDTEAKSARFFYTGESTQLRPDKKLFPNCPGPPDAKTFDAHGIYLRPARASGHYDLYAVSHGAVESIQVFAIDATGGEPSLSWTGCVPMPEGDKGNAVAAFSDGTIITTVSDRPGTTKAQELNGELTGDVLEWKPGADSFRVIPGTQLAGNNGLEISLDETEFYVVAFGTETVAVFSRQDPSKPLRQVVAPGFMPDNLRWSGDRLIAAGPMYDEPACGGTRRALSGNPILTACHRGYMIAELNPKTMSWTMLAYGEPNAEFNGVATGVLMGDTLWIGGFSGEGVAYRTLPHPPSSKP